VGVWSTSFETLLRKLSKGLLAAAPSFWGHGVDLSIIVCTRNRRDSLKACLDSIALSLSAISDITTEIVVVDNGSRDGTGDLLRSWATAAACSMTVVEEAKGGLARARNRGVAAATGRLLAFTDDDCRLSRTHLRDLVSHDRVDSEPVVRGGRVELGDPQDLPCTIKSNMERRRLDRRQRMTLDIAPAGFILGCNMAMRRVVFDKLGSFDERFGAGAAFKSGEDTDFVLRAYFAGIPVEYVPDMVVYHFHGRRNSHQLARLLASYDEGDGALYAKFLWRHPELIRLLYWDIRNGVRELFGGPKVNAALGYSHRQKVAGNVRGMMRMVASVLEH
jgi:GT2 family glycosyltransferase